MIPSGRPGITAARSSRHSWLSSGLIRTQRPKPLLVGGCARRKATASMWGLVPEKYIYGKAVFRYWPIDKMGSLD